MFQVGKTAYRNVVRRDVPEPRLSSAVEQTVKRLFLLSPAKVTGARAGMLLNPNAPFPLARKFYREGLPLGEIFTFASGLYFRGKLSYAQHFAAFETGGLIRVITSNQGLVDPQRKFSPDQLRAFGEVDIDGADPRYLEPMRRDALSLAKRL